MYPTVQVDDGYGGTKPGVGAPVTVGCIVQPATSETDAVSGYAIEPVYRVIARRLPAGPWSRVEWDGDTWQVVDDPKRFRGSRRVAHDEALIRRR
ncbi:MULTISPECIES: hypothetical protein [unclassified Streptomyces]|uniref:hypothetical protein n=1 Tax=unclassified Streptomyces TaxID=2593676 RepID=UPI0035DFC56D